MVKPEFELADKIRSRGWRQGSFLPSEFLMEVRDQDEGVASEKQCVGIVISQDCDLVHHSFDAEPFAEAVIGEQVDKLGGNYVHVKNPRCLHVSISTATGQKMAIEFKSKNRIQFDRTMLSNTSPTTEFSVDKDTVSNIAYWISRRYTRPAFPDAFNERVKGLESALSSAFNNNEAHKSIVGIWLSLSSYSELAEDEMYEVKVCVVVKDEDLSERSVSLFAQKVQDLIEAHLAKEGTRIRVVGCKVLSDDEFTIYDERKMRRWDFDDLTIRDGGVEELVSTSP